jgi:hypothetical protein
LYILGEGQLIQEVKLVRVNHDKMRKQVKTVHCQKARVTGRLSHYKKRWIPLLKYDQSQDRHILK